MWYLLDYTMNLLHLPFLHHFLKVLAKFLRVLHIFLLQLPEKFYTGLKVATLGIFDVFFVSMESMV
jgi:hypothetical protein